MFNIVLDIINFIIIINRDRILPMIQETFNTLFEQTSLGTHLNEFVAKSL